MNALFFIIYFLVLFYIVRKLTLLILTSYFKNKTTESLITNDNKEIFEKRLILKGTIDRNFEIKNEMTIRNPNQKLCPKYNKNVYRGFDGRYKSFKN
jgi:hypothetical protein